MVKAIEQGTRSGSLSMLNKLATTLGISTSDLMASGRECVSRLSLQRPRRSWASVAR
ncbi:hypothetical protein ACFV9C_33855 [Kribbella sp. NPDC059898]|uniref:hypothetical protein n=1 Tax=Kribbella sp. NPDC059898 TaxID=3346995 RepID=UPI00366A52EF